MKKIYASKLITISADASMQEAKRLMRDKRIRHLPVVDKEKFIVGMFSLHDVSDSDKLQDIPVQLFASFPVHAVSADASLSSAANLMLSKKISSVLVVKDDEAIGILTSDDLLQELLTILNEKEKSENFSMDKVARTVEQICNTLSNAGI